jgi:hypothetical protein
VPSQVTSIATVFRMTERPGFGFRMPNPETSAERVGRSATVKEHLDDSQRLLLELLGAPATLRRST